jgi:mannosyl-oligosaccharide alpha-1,2-mannosidase
MTQDTFFGSCHLSQLVSSSNGLIFDRPEAIESVFILYRITGDPTLRERAWKMFNAIVEHTLTDIAHAGLDDCTVQNPPKSDRMESFWLAETLKYFYLIFSEPDVVSLDDYVLNTEAHPLKRPS